MKISDLPFVPVLAEWIWSGDAEVAADSNSSNDLIHLGPALCLKHIDFFEVQDFVSSGCLSQAATKVTGVAIIVGACFNKTPTVLNMMEAKSSEGFSPMALYMELLFYANSSIYSIKHKHPFTAYGENLVLLVQCIAMVYLLWHYSKDTIKLMEKVTVISLSIMYSLTVIYWLPPEWRYLLHAFNDVIIVYSGGLQVAETFRVKHTGAQSIVTTSMNLIGEVIRILTTLEETGGDFNMLLSYGFCATLSITMFAQYFWYQKNTMDFYRQQQEKKTQ